MHAFLPFTSPPPSVCSSSCFCLFLVLNCFPPFPYQPSFTSLHNSLSPSSHLFSYPHVSLLSTRRPPPHQPKGPAQPPVCAQRAWEKMGHKQHSKQTTCFLPRSRVVKCVDRNRSGQPCSRIRTDRTDSGRKITDQQGTYPRHIKLCGSWCRSQAWGHLGTSGIQKTTSGWLVTWQKINLIILYIYFIYTFECDLF